MRQSLIPSLEMVMIVITCLKGEPYVRARRWMETMDQDPQRAHADHWCEQTHQEATLLLPFLPARETRPAIQQRDAGKAPNGQPDANDPGRSGRRNNYFAQ